MSALTQNRKPTLLWSFAIKLAYPHDAILPLLATELRTFRRSGWCSLHCVALELHRGRQRRRIKLAAHNEMVAASRRQPTSATQSASNRSSKEQRQQQRHPKKNPPAVERRWQALRSTRPGQRWDACARRPIGCRASSMGVATTTRLIIFWVAALSPPDVCLRSDRTQTHLGA